MREVKHAPVHRNRLGFYSCVSCVHALPRIVNRAKTCWLHFLRRLQEKHVREKLRDHLKSVVSMQTELMEVQKKVKEGEAKITATHSRQERLLESANRSASGEPVFGFITRSQGSLSKWCLSMLYTILISMVTILTVSCTH